MPKVAIIKCVDYASNNTGNAVKNIFELLGLHELIKPKMKVLLKPNLLTNLNPVSGATTHPNVVKAIADEVLRLGALPYLGDSPGGIGLLYEKVLNDTGMTELGIPTVNFEEKGARKLSNLGGKIDPIYISNAVLSFDIMINIPKLKTHELTQMTCGIKNMFGCVPGLYKVLYHADAPKPFEFSQALVDLYIRIPPAITIVDSIVAMEGQGPTNGKLKHLGIIVASTDTVAADAVCSKIIGYDPMEILTTRIAYQRGYGEARIEKIEIVGGTLEVSKDFRHPSGITAILNRIPYPAGRLLKPLIHLIKIRPKIDSNKCVKCLMCVKACPSKAIDGTSFNINRNKCIMCFCCRELCKYGAVKMEESLLWKILNLKRKIAT